MFLMIETCSRPILYFIANECLIPFSTRRSLQFSTRSLGEGKQTTGMTE